MSVDNFNTAINPKVSGTRYLAQAFDEVDTFIMLSSAAAIVGNRGQGNYAAGCAYQDAFAQNSDGKATHFVSLNLPLLFGTGALNEARQEQFRKQGVTPMSMKEFCVLLDYALSADCRQKNIKQLVAGIEGVALKQVIDQFGALNPMFSHLTASATSSAVVAEDVDRSNAHLGITADLGPEEVHKRLCIAIASRISTLAAIDYDEIDLDIPILEFGLDSLVAIELKNFLQRTFSTTTLETSEILGLPSIKALADLVAERSQLVTTPPTAKADDSNTQQLAAEEDIAQQHNHECCKRTKKLRTLPLLDLKTLFDYHLANHQAIWTEEE